MVNNYPEYAAGVSYQKAEENVKHFYNAQVKVDPSDDSLSALLTKDGVVIAELPDGGGGSSDFFSTAEVTIITAEGKANTIMLPFIYDGEYSMVGATFNNVGTQTFTVPLYKGEGDATIASIEAINIAVTGNIEYQESDGIIIITGDGTITVDDGEA